MSVLLRAVERAAEMLRDAGLEFVLIGGAAIVARVRVRFTDDVDLVVAMESAGLDALLEHATRRGYTFAATDRPLFDAGLVHLVDPEGIGLDLIRADAPFLKRVVERGTSEAALGGARVATLEDLVLLKLEANRPLDIDDILAIKEVAVLDRGYLDTEAAALGVEALLRLYLD